MSDQPSFTRGVAAELPDFKPHTVHCNTSPNSFHNITFLKPHPYPSLILCPYLSLTGLATSKLKECLRIGVLLWGCFHSSHNRSISVYFLKVNRNCKCHMPKRSVPNPPQHGT